MSLEQDELDEYPEEEAEELALTTRRAANIDEARLVAHKMLIETALDARAKNSG